MLGVDYETIGFHEVYVPLVVLIPPEFSQTAVIGRLKSQLGRRAISSVV